MTSTEFLELSEEDQYLHVRGLDDAGRKLLCRTLMVNGHLAAFERASTALEIMHADVRPGHPYYGRQLLLRTHFADQSAHRASAAHALASKEGSK